MTDSAFVYNHIDYSNEFAGLLKLKEERIQRMVSSDPLTQFKPVVRGTRKNRACKEHIYKLAGNLARDNQLSGNMVSLGAAYALEIYKEFSTVITDRFVNVEKDKTSFLRLSDYYRNLLSGDNFDSLVTNLSEEDRVNLSKVSLVRGDIFNLLEMKRATDLAVVDLDLMQRLDRGLVDKIYRSLEGSGVTKNRFLLTVWSTYGRSCTEDEYDSMARPYLIYKFALDRASRYDLVDYRTYKYCDNHIPLKVEMLVLENKP